MKKTTLTLIMTLLVSAMVGTMFDSARANPYMGGYVGMRRIYPPVKPTITILNPLENNTIQNSRNLTLAFNATMKSEIGCAWMTEVQYKPSWQKANSTTQQWIKLEPINGTFSEQHYHLSLNEIPEGNQSVFIAAFGYGEFIDKDEVLNYFYATAYHSIGFTIDTIPPSISVVDLENNTYFEPQVPLTFVVSAFSKLSYVLDGQNNVSLDGNTTLMGLSNGLHNVTVYASDTAGNIGASKTIIFTVAVPEPFPVVPVAAAIGIAVAVGLLLTLRKRRKEAQQT